LLLILINITVFVTEILRIYQQYFSQFQPIAIDVQKSVNKPTVGQFMNYPYYICTGNQNIANKSPLGIIINSINSPDKFRCNLDVE